MGILVEWVPSDNHTMSKKTAIIIGAGPAGLTAAYELLTRSDVKPIVLETSSFMGGISRTVQYKGNRIDIGGHRFFSKSDRVMNWWLNHMPIEGAEAGSDPAACDRVMLLRKRTSRIYFLRKFFEYPISMTLDTLSNLGAARIFRIGTSYVFSVLFPFRSEENLEQFFINRFGRELYATFFKDYTEKVWGVSCREISPEWGAQRVKGLSVIKTIQHFLKKRFKRHKSEGVAQKGMETSLIEQFLYPKFGPGQMWETVANKIRELGGEIRTGIEVCKILTEGQQVVAVEGVDRDGTRKTWSGDFFFSTMPVKDLIRALDCYVPNNVLEVSDHLQYRDFLTVGLLLKNLKVSDSDAARTLIRDTWIYIQEPDVLAGRLQIFNNWSPYLVRQKDQVWVGVEYFCFEGDSLWNQSDEEIAKLAVTELDKIGLIDRDSVLDATVLRMPKTYPAYFGTYTRFEEVRRFVDTIPNLFPVGRNGMHKYNNQDHSMLTAMVAVDNIIEGRTDKANIWAVNTETDYHEAKKGK